MSVLDTSLREYEVRIALVLERLRRRPSRKSKLPMQTQGQLAPITIPCASPAPGIEGSIQNEFDRAPWVDAQVRFHF